MNAFVIERGRIPDQLNSMDFASSTDLATPAIPPAFRMCSMNAFCCSVALPLAVFTSIAANTGTSIPTISGVTVTFRYPIRSLPPGLPTPNCTYLPVLGSGKLPLLFLHSLTGPRLHANLISCWMLVSLKSAAMPLFSWPMVLDIYSLDFCLAQSIAPAF